jgi:hypothetical protein
MASPGGTGAADVDIPIDWLDFKSANPTTGVPAGQTDELQQFPIVDQAQAKLAALERLTGIGQAPPVAFDPHFLAHEWADNPGEVFLRIKTPPPIAFGNDAPTDRVGGLATPDITPSALSRRFGLASGNADIFRTGTFNPAEYFPSAKLLGIFELKSLLQAVSLAAQPADAPTLTTTEIAGGTETRFRMVQRVAGQPLAPVLRTNEGGPTDLTLTAITRLLDGQPPQTIVQGEMTHFKVNLVGVLIIWFDRLRFYRENGRKPDVDVDLNPENGVTFGGPLEFINTLREFIPANGFSDPPNLSVTPAGITAGYSLGLPAVQLGVLALSNISLGAAFTIPFDGKSPTARFNFAERHNTFNLTVSLFGGGGFVALVVDTKEVKEIEAALEFGAAIAINLGVASGSVYVKGGFYFHFATDRVEFEGYVEIGGRLSVLGLISVSLTFHLSLNYEMLAKGVNGPQAISRLFGQATLVVEIEILFFSVSVSVTVEKTFIGSEADPTFLDFVPDQSVWDEYCTAFA